MIPSVDYPRVKYVTEHQENERPLILSYDKFLKFLLDNFKINDKEKVLLSLNSHEIVFIDNLTGEHFIKSLYEDVFNVDFKTLIEINSNKENKSIVDDTIKRNKISMDSFKNVFRDTTRTKRRL
jgi:endoglucanase Acf2